MHKTRAARALCLGAAVSILLPVVAEAQVTRFFDPSTRTYLTYDPTPKRGWSAPAEYRRQIVPFQTREAPGTIVIDSRSKHLYFVLAGGQAIRYGIGVGREGFGWQGVVKVGRKAEWPTWTPPSEMIAREPTLAKFASGMPGGPDNPLGARALYLYDGGRDTMFRIHGTNEPWTIGHNVSSGCIRMMNHDVVELHHLASVGAKVIVQ